MLKAILSLSVKAQVEGRAETVKNSKCTIEDRQREELRQLKTANVLLKTDRGKS